MANASEPTAEQLHMRQPSTSDPDTSFVQHFCVPFLVGAQNQDGGWGFHPGQESRVWPPFWCIRALQNVPAHSADETLDAARDYLLSAQLEDGSWPPCPAQITGSSITSLACSVLSSDYRCDDTVAAGLQWLGRDFPRDSAPWRLLLRKIFSTASH